MYNDLFHIGSFTVHTYGLMIAIGILAAAAVGVYRAKRRNMSADAVYSITLYGIVAGFVGAKLLYYITEFDAIAQNPALLADIGNGFVVYGGIIAGVLVAWLYCRKKKYSFLQYFDLLIPSVAIAQGFGRIGCFMAGCCYGKVTDAWCGIQSPYFPPDVHLVPTQIISSIGDFLIAAALLAMARKQKFEGQIAAWYMLLYGTGRFVIEFWRDDPRGSVGALSTSQFISLFIVAAGIACALYFAKKAKMPRG